MTTARALNLAGLLVGLGFGATTFGVQGAQIPFALWVFVFTALIWAVSDSQKFDRWLAARRRVGMAEFYRHIDTFTPQSRREIRQLMFFWATGTWGILLALFLFQRLTSLGEFTGSAANLTPIIPVGPILVALAVYGYCALFIHSMLFKGGHQ